MVRNLSFFAVAAVLIFAGANAASAQEMPAARNTITASTGSMNFDLSGTGNTWNISGRATQALTSNIAVEYGALFARPALQGGTGTIILPEVQLQYHWRVNRVAPYAGGGVGFLHQRRGFITTNNFALGAAGGARLYFNDRVAALGEFRIHTIDRDFTGTTAEIMGGVSYAF
jgi:autotransporter translocation and assembly factor TamB